MSAERLVRLVVLWGLTGACGLVTAEDTESPDLEFLEYLGSWEEAEEDWILLAPEVSPEKDKNNDESVDAPDGEKLAELDDES
jgi:hypothetical protein